MDGWEIGFLSFWNALFSGAMLVSFSVGVFEKTLPSPHTPKLTAVPTASKSKFISISLDPPSAMSNWDIKKRGVFGTFHTFLGGKFCL